jgi:Uma2 family endonuclease
MNSAARITKPPKPPAVEEESRLWAFTLADYHRMCEVGILREQDRCEFINGQVLKVMPPNPPHSFVTQHLMRAFFLLIPAGDWFIKIQDPVTLTDDEPQPDISVALGPAARYRTRHPGPQDLVLVVEVSDTRVRVDAGEKLAVYARNKIPQYWIVNIPERRVEVYTRPRGGRSPTYQTRTDYGPADAISVVVAGKTLGTIPVGELFP